ncbi:hypothetical protein [Catenuloplanes indicus]|uniref:Uncharacterized protein n=1 Tax=Catenuloplanes indicus TaxID=137267 RepID=A0AAE3WAT8_9ACTN|nr:hypothetical protein [Catenuloplanes indicus]MDQ0371575.1 hypothetical protein [Catenuloplanes indicus]
MSDYRLSTLTVTGLRDRARNLDDPLGADDATLLDDAADLIEDLATENQRLRAQLSERAASPSAGQDEPAASVPTNCDGCGFPHCGPCDPDDLAAELERRHA